MIIVVVVVAIIVIGVVAFISMYNRFARQRNTVEESWRQVDVELQRRHDLIGNLVEVTKASARFEQQTLTQVVAARSQAVAAHGAGPAAQGQAEQALNGALSNFFAVAEQYPNLKANQNFVDLQQQMVETEDRIAAGRRFYNGKCAPTTRGSTRSRRASSPTSASSRRRSTTRSTTPTCGRRHRSGARSTH